jgi:hypothetical protein
MVVALRSFVRPMSPWVMASDGDCVPWKFHIRSFGRLAAVVRALRPSVGSDVVSGAHATPLAEHEDYVGLASRRLPNKTRPTQAVPQLLRSTLSTSPSSDRGRPPAPSDDSYVLSAPPTGPATRLSHAVQAQLGQSNQSKAEPSDTGTRHPNNPGL